MLLILILPIVSSNKINSVNPSAWKMEKSSSGRNLLGSNYCKLCKHICSRVPRLEKHENKVHGVVAHGHKLPQITRAKAQEMGWCCKLSDVYVGVFEGRSHIFLRSTRLCTGTGGSCRPAPGGTAEWRLGRGLCLSEQNSVAQFYLGGG